MTEKKTDKNIGSSIGKTFPVPFFIEEIKETITFTTNKSANISKEKVINQAISLHTQGNILEAAKYYQYCISQGVKDFRVFSNYALILKDNGKLKEAENSLRNAIKLNPYSAESHSNLGNILNDLGNTQEAELSSRKAIEIDPRNEDAKHNLSLILLKNYNFKEGLILYESRMRKRGIKKPFITSRPEWTPNSRGTVLLWAEQGIGDEIIFASFIPELVKLVDQLIVKVDKRLIPLFKRSFNKRIIYIDNLQILEEEKYDSQIAMGSIIKYFRTDKESFRKGIKRYLKVDGIKTNIYREKILTDSKLKKIIGISWSSKSQRTKSISLEKFIMGIYSPNICFVNLQYGNTKGEIYNIKKKYNIDIYELHEVDNFNNLDDLASLINACDMVVSIENTTFALAGALGINSKILLAPNSLWFNGRNDLKSYWFENQSFFRQASIGEWGKELNQIKNEIQHFT